MADDRSKVLRPVIAAFFKRPGVKIPRRAGFCTLTEGVHALPLHSLKSPDVF
jgi:hypothetical protein